MDQYRKSKAELCGFMWIYCSLRWVFMIRATQAKLVPEEIFNKSFSFNFLASISSSFEEICSKHGDDDEKKTRLKWKENLQNECCR